MTGIPVNAIPFAVAFGAITDATAAALVAAAAGKRHYVTDVIITNGHATVSTVVQLLTAATEIARGDCVALGGGWSHTFRSPPKTVAGEALNVKCVTTGASVNGTVCGYTI